MHQHRYRPPSVWVTQAILVMALISAAVAVKNTWFLCSSAEPSFSFSCSSPLAINALLSSFLQIAIYFLVFWGLQKRKRYGKWLAVSLLLDTMVIGIVESHFLKLAYHSITQWQPLPAPPYECWEKEFEWSPFSYSCGYRSHQELVFRIISEVFPVLLLGFLAVRLLYSQAAKQFFQ